MEMQPDVYKTGLFSMFESGEIEDCIEFDCDFSAQKIAFMAVAAIAAVFAETQYHVISSLMIANPVPVFSIALICVGVALFADIYYYDDLNIVEDDDESQCDGREIQVNPDNLGNDNSSIETISSSTAFSTVKNEEKSAARALKFDDNESMSTHEQKKVVVSNLNHELFDQAEYSIKRDIDEKIAYLTSVDDALTLQYFRHSVGLEYKAEFCLRYESLILNGYALLLSSKLSSQKQSVQQSKEGSDTSISKEKEPSMELLEARIDSAKTKLRQFKMIHLMSLDKIYTLEYFQTEVADKGKFIQMYQTMIIGGYQALISKSFTMSSTTSSPKHLASPQAKGSHNPLLMLRSKIGDANAKLVQFREEMKPKIAPTTPLRSQNNQHAKLFFSESQRTLRDQVPPNITSSAHKNSRNSSLDFSALHNQINAKADALEGNHIEFIAVEFKKSMVCALKLQYVISIDDKQTIEKFNALSDSDKKSFCTEYQTKIRDMYRELSVFKASLEHQVAADLAKRSQIADLKLTKFCTLAGVSQSPSGSSNRIETDKSNDI